MLGTWEDIGPWLRERRERLGMTQSEVAEKCNVTSQHLSYVECNKKMPSLALLIRLNAFYVAETQARRKQ